MSISFRLRALRMGRHVIVQSYGLEKQLDLQFALYTILYNAPGSKGYVVRVMLY